MSNPKLDIEKWILDHNLVVKRTAPWNGGRKWILEKCPWNADHDDDAAYIAQFSDGGVIAGCLHSSCRETQNFNTLRDKLEPGWQKDAKSETKAKFSWDKAKPISVWLSEPDPNTDWLVRNIIAPMLITLFSSPRGIGKSLVAEFLAVRLAKKGIKVLYLDTDNPAFVVKERFRKWGAENIENLFFMGKGDAPPLTDASAWGAFPCEKYQVVMIDSLGSSTPGVTEQEGKQTTEYLEIIRTLTAKGPAFLVLLNTVKSGANFKGRGEIIDRSDIFFEVRDATDLKPSGNKSWWSELPPADEASWAQRAARRKGRKDFRLGFVPSKFRVGVEPEPFCLEVKLPDDKLWTVFNVTNELVECGEKAVEQKNQKNRERLRAALLYFKQEIRTRNDSGKPLNKTEAEKFLQGNELSRTEARDMIKMGAKKLWLLEIVGGTVGTLLLPIEQSANSEQQNNED